MYESYWDKEKKQPRSKNIMTFGYVDERISDGIPDPIAYCKEFVKQKKEERAALLADETRPRAFVYPTEKNIGHFPLLVTSELDMDPLQIYKTYHSLWKIEESFRITKSFLDARPVYVQKKETIYFKTVCFSTLEYYVLRKMTEVRYYKGNLLSS